MHFGIIKIIVNSFELTKIWTNFQAGVTNDLSCCCFKLVNSSCLPLQLNDTWTGTFAMVNYAVMPGNNEGKYLYDIGKQNDILSLLVMPKWFPVIVGDKCFMWPLDEESYLNEIWIHLRYVARKWHFMSIKVVNVNIKDICMKGVELITHDF